MAPLPVVSARDSDVPALLKLLHDCVARMRAQGIEQWDEVYPAEADLRRDIAAGTLWVMREGDGIIGCMTLDTQQDPLWAAIDWRHTQEPISVVHRLMIAPSHQGRGLARRLMEFAEAQANRNGSHAIHLDCFLSNPASMALYEKLGYRNAGTAQMRKGPFAAFEKALSFLEEGWPKPEPREFTGRFITLRPMNFEQDMDELFAISHADAQALELWRYLPWSPFPNAGELREHYRDWEANAHSVIFTVYHHATGQRLGSISLMNIRPEHGVAELGFIWYGPAAQRTKINTEANYLLLRHCFEDLGYRRMEWKCHSENERSHRAALRLGYRYEGTFRQHMVVKGRNRDTVWLAILDHEWPGVRARLEQQLYTTDSEGW